ncbi:MAG: rod shape-determining protein MreD [Gammaproteobacteria bacterium AqS3]|nr:rod shape-determining protein MreD [Gammaproteobacteria bacterium AqS3]
MPDWVLLALLYWSLALSMPALYWAVGFGLMMDAVTGTPFGVHALAYLVAVQLCLMLTLRVRQYRRWQQSLFVGLMLLLSELLQLTLMTLLTENLWNWLLLSSSIIGALVWPGVYRLLRHLRRNHPAG